MKTERIALPLIVSLAVAGCATRDSSNLVQLHRSAVLLSRATTEALSDAVSLVEDNAVQKALEGDTEALEDMFLVSGGSFRMTPPGLGVLGAVVRAGEQVEILGIVAAVFLLALAIAIFLGLTAVADLLGRRLYGHGPRGNTVGAFTLGWLVLSGITLLPIVGFLAYLWFAAEGVGAVVLSLGGEKA